MLDDDVWQQDDEDADAYDDVRWMINACQQYDDYVANDEDEIDSGDVDGDDDDDDVDDDDAGDYFYYVDDDLDDDDDYVNDD